MSWISGFADKAEQILVKLDQSAADKLQKKKTLKPPEEPVLTEVTSVPSPIQQRPKVSPPPSPAKKPSLPHVRSVPAMVNQSQEEERLIDFLNDNTKSSSEVQIKVDTASQGEDDRQVEGEKQMLKNEVRVLNNELSLLLHRTRAAEKESQTLKEEVHEGEKSRQSLQDEIKKLSAQLKTVERLNETLAAEKKQLEEKAQSVASQHTQQLQQQLLTLREQQSSLALRLESKERECAGLECARHQHQTQVESLTQRLAELRAELDQYRARAQRTLSDKEALISQLRDSNSDAAVESSFQTELQQLREERQQLVEEVQEVNAQLEVARSRLIEGEQLLEKVRESAARTQHELQDRVAQETHRRRIIEDDFRVQTQELRLVREEASTQRGQLTAQLREREAELMQLRGQLSTRPPSPPRGGEMELRLSNLTKTLIQKQTSLESATTERNQLRMQLEQLEHKHRENLLLLHQARVISANDTDDAKAQVPSFMVESPFDTGVARRVKRAYSSLDAVSIRTGVFLRRYPLARILVILYVILLHLLVLLVLCSRTPDNAQQ